MNIKVTDDRIKYSVNGNRVVAVITNCKSDLCDYLRYTHHMYNIDDKCILNDTYMGQVVCDESDEFSLKYGKRMAKQKALAKYRRAIYRKYTQVIHDEEKRFERIRRMLQREADFSEQSNIKTLKEIGGVEFNSFDIDEISGEAASSRF